MRATPPNLKSLPPSSIDSQRSRYSQELAEYSYQQYSAALKAAEATERLKQHEITYPPKARLPTQVIEPGEGDGDKTPMPRSSLGSGSGSIGSGIAQAAVKAVDFALGRGHGKEEESTTASNTSKWTCSTEPPCVPRCLFAHLPIERHSTETSTS